MTDEPDTSQKSDIIPAPPPPALQMAQKMLASAKRVFANEIEVADFLNVNSRGHFTAAIFHGKVIVAAGALHPDEVISQYVEKHPEAIEIESPPTVKTEPVKSTPQEPPGLPPEALDLSGKLGRTPNSPRNSELGPPPRFKGASVKTASD
jgi:hypothetical protein